MKLADLRTRVCGIDLQGVYRKKAGTDLFSVVGVAEEPTVTLENQRTGERLHLVIGSPLFREFVEYVPKDET